MNLSLQERVAFSETVVDSHDPKPGLEPDAKSVTDFISLDQPEIFIAPLVHASIQKYEHPGITADQIPVFRVEPGDKTPPKNVFRISPECARSAEANLVRWRHDGFPAAELHAMDPRIKNLTLSNRQGGFG